MSDDSYQQHDRILAELERHTRTLAATLEPNGLLTHQARDLTPEQRKAEAAKRLREVGR
jgi:hypothetical protein